MLAAVPLGAAAPVHSAAATAEPPTATLRGTVADASGHALPSAVVALPLLGLQAITDAAGSFTIAPVARGRYDLLVQRVGYAPLLATVAVPSAADLALVLRETPFRLPPVTVTATRSPMAPLDSPLPADELDTVQLRRTHGVSLAQAVETLPGVRALSTGEQIGKPMIRGLGGARVLSLDNGHRLEDYSWSDEDGPALDVRLAQRVEVIRGPASVLYGSDALGGVVNAIPAPLPNARGGSPFIRTGIEVYGSSNNVELGTALRFEGARDRFGWRAFAVGRHASDFHTPDGEVPNTGFGALDGEVAAGVQGDRGNAMLRYVRTGGEFKLLEAGGPAVAAAGEVEAGPERKLSDDRVQLSGNLLRGSWRLEGKAQWQRHTLIELSDEFPGVVAPATKAPGSGPSGVPGADTGSGPGKRAEKKEATAFDLLLSTATVDLLAHHASGALRGTLGISGATQHNDTRGPIPLVPDADVRWGALFACEQWSVGRWSLLGGVRGDTRRLHADANSVLSVADQTRHDQAVSADAGAVYSPVNGLSLAANVGRAWRSPTTFELFANGPHVGEQRYEVGDPGLGTETSLDLDGSVRWQRGLLRGEVSAYRNLVDEYIFVAATGDTIDSLPVFRHRQTDAVLTGGEASLQLQALPSLALDARAEVVRGKERASGDPLPLIPPVRGVVGAELTSDALGWAKRGRVAAHLELVDEQRRPSALDRSTKGYILLHLEGGIERPVAGRAMRLDLRVANVLDHPYRDYLSRYKAFALDPGRNFTLRLAVGL